MLEDQGRLRTCLAVFDFREHPIIEDGTVLQNFDERGSLVLMRPAQDFL